MGKEYKNERHKTIFHARNLKPCVNISFYTTATLGCGINLAWQNPVAGPFPTASYS